MKTKKLLFTISFLVLTFFVNAQDKYQFMIIEYNTTYNHLSISIDGDTFFKEGAEVAKGDKLSNSNPLLKKVKEYQDKDWEVMSFNNHTISVSTGPSYSVYLAYLRKRK